MFDELETIKREAAERIAAIGDPGELEHLRIEYLGRKGLLTEKLRRLGSLPKEDRPRAGALANEI